MPGTPARVKVCGITNLADAELAVGLGAWALGMIFFDGSPRSCSLAEAQRIAPALRRAAHLCGVFVNAPLARVVEISEQLGLDMLQLHGDEGPSFCGEAARRSGARVIKAGQVSGPGDVRDLERYHVDFHLLDGRARQRPSADGRRGAAAHRAPGASLGALLRSPRGGTGESFDWTLLAARRSKVPLILSGGLNAENVARAIAMTRPYAVDTASGTEDTPGRKDPARLRAFFAAAGADTAEGRLAGGLAEVAPSRQPAASRVAGAVHLESPP